MTLHPEVKAVFYDNYEYEIKRHCEDYNTTMDELSEDVLSKIKKIAENETRLYCLEYSQRIWKEIFELNK